MHPSCQSNPFPFNIAKGFLDVDEQASSNREEKRHGTYIPKDLMPFFEADPPLVGGGVEEKNI